MNSYLNELVDDLFDFSSPVEILDLESEQCQQALQLSQNIGNEAKQWHIYLQALAVFGFSEWLKKREPTISINQKISSILEPQYVNVIDAVCNLQVGEFKVCLIPTISFTDDEITIPRAVVDLPEFTAHLYVVIAIEEELEVAGIRGFIRYDELANYQFNYQSEFQPQRDWTYQLPLAWFNLEPDELLMYLQCYSPATIPLPQLPNNRQIILSQMQGELVNLLPQLNNRPLWQVLTWEQGVAVLTNPELVKWLYNNPTSNSQISTLHLSDFIQMASQQAVNIQRWLDNQIDNVIQALSWQVSPIRGNSSNEPLRPIYETSSNTTQELEGILAEISRNYNIEIPNITNYAYQDISLEVPLRVYAVIWSLPDDEWTLLVVLKVPPGHQVPYGLNLRISDQTQILVEEQLQADTYHDYIVGQVIGNYEDKFLVTITSPNGEVRTLPPFAFFQN